MSHLTDPAWPHLLTRRPWIVREVPQADACVIPARDELHVPRLTIPTDHLVHQHELRHILRRERPGGDWKPSGHKVRDLFRKMIEEAAVEIENSKVGVDTRRCRDNLEWRTVRVTDEIDAAMWYLQIVVTLVPEEWGGTTNDHLRRFFTDQVVSEISDEKRDVLHQLMVTIAKHWRDPVALDEAADWVASRFVRTEDPPATPTETRDSDKTKLSEEEEATDGADERAGISEPSDDDGGPGEAGEGEDERGDSDDQPGDAGPTGLDGGAADPAGDDDDAAESLPGEPHGADIGSPSEVGHERRPTPHFLEDDAYRTEPRLPGESETSVVDRSMLEAEAKAADESKEEELRRAGEVSRFEHLTGGSAYGSIDIHRHTMDRRSSTQFGLAWLPRDTGSVVRYPHRLFPTGRVFAVPAPGGSILVDGSGSMSWHRSMLEKAMERFPNLTAAVYSMHEQHIRAKGSRPFGGFVAKMCVVASAGKLGQLPKQVGCPGHSYGNGDADKACLDYMVKHWPRPWVWVSDGQVEAETLGNWPACDLLMLRHKVFRVRSIEDAIAFLAGKTVTGWTSCYGPDQHIRRGGPFIKRSEERR